jgi:hypothetical protein
MINLTVLDGATFCGPLIELSLTEYSKEGVVKPTNDLLIIIQPFSFRVLVSKGEKKAGGFATSQLT